MGARARVESRQGAGKGEKKELSGHRWVPVSTASAGVDACIAWSNRTLGLGHCVSLGVSISQNYSNNNFSALAVLVHCAQLLFLASGPLLILALVSVPNPPFFLLLGTWPPARLPRRANPLCSPLFPPPPLAYAGSAPWPTLSPQREPAVYSIHAGSTSSVLRPISVRHYKMPLVLALLLHPHPSRILSRATRSSRHCGTRFVS